MNGLETSDCMELPSNYMIYHRKSPCCTGNPAQCHQMYSLKKKSISISLLMHHQDLECIPCEASRSGIPLKLNRDEHGSMMVNHDRQSKGAQASPVKTRNHRSLHQKIPSLLRQPFNISVTLNPLESGLRGGHGILRQTHWPQLVVSVYP